MSHLHCNPETSVQHICPLTGNLAHSDRTKAGVSTVNLQRLGTNPQLQSRWVHSINANYITPIIPVRERIRHDIAQIRTLSV